ncbi:MAG TPA: ribosome-associated translation inhibitor RaiA [Ohtaekwangia sp.]
MKILIQAPDIKPQPELVDFVNEKVSKLERFSDEILESRVLLKMDKSDSRENKICEIKLVVRGHDLFASRQSKSFEEATAEAVEALRKQIESRKK